MFSTLPVSSEIQMKLNRWERRYQLFHMPYFYASDLKYGLEWVREEGGFQQPKTGSLAQLQCSWGTEQASAWGLGGNGEGFDGTDSDPEVVMIIGVLMTLNGK